MNAMNGELLPGLGKKPFTAESVAQAAEGTAQSLRVISMNPSIEEQDRPHLMMSALGWDEFARQLRNPK